MSEIITISVDDLRHVVVEIIADDRIDKILSKTQLTYTEACLVYDKGRVLKWIRSGLLKPDSQNGKGSKIYYSHKRIIQLSKEYRHNLSNLDKILLHFLFEKVERERF